MNGFKQTKKIGWLLMLLLFLLVEGCSLLETNPPPRQDRRVSSLAKERTTRRPPISTSRNKYEGSLWRDESSFGNLWRDHRARFRHDLLSVTELQAVINVPPPAEDEAPQTANTDQEKAAAIMEAFSLRDQLEEEQNDILRSLETMSAEVVRVYPNGNMKIRGRKVDHRQRNQVRYVTQLTGILRPVDVDDTNRVSADKLVYPEVTITRQIQGSLLRSRLAKLAPLLGKQNAGLLERVSDFSKPQSGATQVR